MSWRIFPSSIHKCSSRYCSVRIQKKGESEEKVRNKSKISGRKKDEVKYFPYNKPLINSVNVFFVQSIPVHISFWTTLSTLTIQKLFPDNRSGRFFRTGFSTKDFPHRDFPHKQIFHTQLFPEFIRYQYIWEVGVNISLYEKSSCGEQEQLRNTNIDDAEDLRIKNQTEIS